MIGSQDCSAVTASGSAIPKWVTRCVSVLDVEIVSSGGVGLPVRASVHQSFFATFRIYVVGVIDTAVYPFFFHYSLVGSGEADVELTVHP